MKSLKNFYIGLFFVTWILYPLLLWFLRSWAGREQYDLIILVAIGFMFALIFTGGSFALTYSTFKSKWKFLNSAHTDIPAFGNKTTKTFTVECPDFQFATIKNKLEQKHYETTFYDDAEQHIIKFHSNFFRWSNNGACGMITYDAVAKTVTITCFPMQGYTETIARKTRETVDELGSLILNI